MKKISDLKIKLFADGAHRKDMLELYEMPFVQGFTTNPTLMQKAGIRDYRGFALDILKAIPDRPISFEVFADEFSEMERQAMEIKSWGKQIYVKIPVMNTKGQPTYDLIEKLANQGVPMNVTALFTLTQVLEVTRALKNGPNSIISIFAGRIADTGLDPVPLMQAALEIMKMTPQAELLWASPREVLNVLQADQIGCHIITATNDILKKLSLLNKDLTEYSLETVEMFYQDALKAGFSL